MAILTFVWGNLVNIRITPYPNIDINQPTLNQNSEKKTLKLNQFRVLAFRASRVRLGYDSR